ncbi:MAG: hypothetical protein AMXMBFR7_23000 [Planctomycetota bacterium]
MLQPAYLADPGKGWRRLARCGVLFYLVVLVALVLSGQSVVNEIHSLYELAIGDVSPSMSPAYCSYFLIGSSWFFFPVLLNGLVGIFICWPSVLRPGARRLPQVFLAGVLWLASLVPCYFFAGFRLAQESSEEALTFALGLLSIYLLAGALCFLSALRLRGQSTMIFWLALLPWVDGVVAWGLFFLAQAMRDDLSLFSLWAMIDLIGFAGSIAMLWGWIGWWRAVVRYESPQAPHAA